MRGIPMTVGIALTVASVDGAQVTGTWEMLKGNCPGKYPFAGTFQNNKLHIKTEAGSKQGCGPYGPSFSLEGDKLMGKFAQQDVTLTR